MLRVHAVTPLDGRSVRMTLSDGTEIERDLTDLLDGPVFLRIAAEDAVFRDVRAIDGTLVWPGDVDIAARDADLGWSDAFDEATRHPEPFLRLRRPLSRLAP